MRLPLVFLVPLWLLLGGLNVTTAAPKAEEGSGAEKSAKAWLGVSIQDMTSKLAKSMDLKITEGVLVSEVVERSPAESSGVQEKDVIIEFNSKPITDADDLVKAVGKSEPGAKAELTLIRKGEKKKVTVTLGDIPRRREARVFGFAPRAPRIHVFRSGAVLGVELMELNEQLAEYFQAPEGEGVLITEVRKKSAAEKAGLKAGDVILSVGKRRVNDARDVTRSLRRYEEGDKVEVEVMRKGAKKSLTVEIEDSEGMSDATIFNHLPDVEFFDDFKMDIRPELDELRLRLRNIKPFRHRIEIDDLIPRMPEPPELSGRKTRVL